MSKPFLQQLEEWIDTENFDELTRCEFKVVEMQRNFGRIEAEMLADPTSFLWNDAMALACVKDLKKLRVLCKRADKLFARASKKTVKDSKEVLTQTKPVVESGNESDLTVF